MLTAKQQKFVLEYLIDLDATKAAIRAGYSKKTAQQLGYQLLHKPSVSDAIARAASRKFKAADISSDMILQGLYEEATRFGEGTTQSARVRAWELLGKWQMLFVDRIEVRHSYSDMSDAELAAEMARLTAPAGTASKH